MQYDRRAIPYGCHSKGSKKRVKDDKEKKVDVVNIVLMGLLLVVITVYIIL